MNIEQVLASIDGRALHYEMISDAELDQFAVAALAVFQHPPACPPEFQTEFVGRSLAEILKEYVGGRLQPSLYRVQQAFTRVLPELPPDARAQLHMWLEVTMKFYEEISP